MSTEHYNEPSRPAYVEDDEITLRELILKTQEFFQEVVRNWWLITTIVVIATILFLANAYLKDTIYRAETTFILNGNDDNRAGQFAGILGQFGLGGGINTKYNPDKIIELSKSLHIIQQVLFREAEIDSIQDFFANHIIRELELHDDWKNTKLEGLLFTHDSLAAFSLDENRALRALHTIVALGNKDFDPLVDFVYLQEAGLMEVTVQSTSEDLSYEFCRAMYEVMEAYYVQKTVEPQQQTYNTMKQKVDSLGARLASLESELARYTDSNYGTYSATSQIRRGHLQRELSFTASAYGEAIKNMEVASFSLETAKPIFQLVDTPLLPLPEEKNSYLKAILIGVALGGFLGVAFVIGRKIFRDVMAT